MRVLLTFSVAFAAAALAALMAVPVMAAVILGLVCALGALVAHFLRKYSRVTVILAGLSAGFLWCAGYVTLVTAPAEQMIGKTAVISGTAMDYSVPSTYGIRVTADITDGSSHGKAVVWLSTDVQLKPGDTFSTKASVMDSSRDGNYSDRAEGVVLLAYGKGAPEISPCDRVPVRFFPKVIARRLEQSLCRAVPQDVLGYALALATGNRSELPAAERENLKTAGIYHALALSGMHMTILIGTLSLLIRRRKRLAMIGIPVCILFTIVTGASASLVRACVMQCFVLLAPVLGREEDMPTSLGAAALVLILQNPWCMLGWGTQLSFSSMAGIALFSERIHAAFGRHEKAAGRYAKKLRRLATCSLATTFSAMVFSVPLLMACFGMISLVSPLTNLLTGWMTAWCFRGSLLTALVGLAAPGLAEVMGWCLAWGLRYVSAVAGLLAKIPFAALYTDSVYAFVWVLLCYGVLVPTCLAPEKERRLTIPICCVLFALAVCLGCALLENGGFVFTVLDVGQGQCLVARDQDRTVMIDCGGSYGTGAGDTAAAYLDSLGEQQVDVLILTHYDTDHVGGVLELMQRVTVDQLLMPDYIPDNGIRQEIEQAAAEGVTKIRYLSEDVSFIAGSCEITVYTPKTFSEENNASLAVLLESGATEILVTGDLDELGELLLLRTHDLPDVDVLVAGHHGSKYSTSQALLEAVRPEIVLISVGKNSYGHPAEETLARIECMGAVIYRTDDSGTLRLKGA